MSRHPYDPQQQPSCSYQPRPTCKFTQQSPADSSCSSTLAPPLTSPIGNPAIGNRLNPLAQPGFGYPRGPLQYDLNPQYMGGARKSGGRRPKEFEMGPEIEDQEEIDKRNKRRQRNKEAAARCRQRRLDLMTSLQEQVDKFKAENGITDEDLEDNREGEGQPPSAQPGDTTPPPSVFKQLKPSEKRYSLLQKTEL